MTNIQSVGFIIAQNKAIIYIFLFINNVIYNWIFYNQYYGHDYICDLIYFRRMRNC